MLTLVSPVVVTGHGLVHDRVSLVIEGDRIGGNLSLPASYLARFDDSADGRLSIDEVQAHRGEILALVDEHVVLVDGEGARPHRTFADVVLPEAFVPGGDGTSAHVQIMLRYAWDHAPSEVDLSFSFFPPGRAELPLVWRSDRAERPRQATLVAPRTTLRLVGEGEATEGTRWWLLGLLVMACGVALAGAVWAIARDVSS